MKRLLSILSCLILLHTAIASTDIPPSENFAKNPEAIAFIQMMVKKYNFKTAELTNLFSQVKVRPKVIRHVQSPIEQNPWYIYRSLYITNERVVNGAKFWKKYEKDLAKAEKMFGVPAKIIVATIGIESVYGQNTGRYPVIDALVNLAFSDTKRAPYFRDELEQFLLLTREQHLDPLNVMGSYAGAIGQPQFMPSSYRHYAVNFSDNASIDLMHDEIDVIGSVANYYKKNGWQMHEPIASPAKLSQGKFQPVDTDEQGLKNTLIKLQAKNGEEYWFTYHNFNVIKRYNHSDLYAMAVFQLSYYIDRLHR